MYLIVYVVPKCNVRIKYLVIYPDKWLYHKNRSNKAWLSKIVLFLNGCISTP